MGELSEKRELVDQTTKPIWLDNYQQVRNQLLHRIINIFAIVSLPALAVSLFKGAPRNDWLTITVYLVVYLLLLLAVIIKKKSKFQHLAKGTAIGLYFFSVILLARFGTSGGGLLFLLTFCMMTSILLGTQSGRWAVLASIVSIGLIGAGLSTGIIPIDVETMANSTSGITWFLAVAVFAILALVMNATFGSLLSHLRNSLNTIAEHSEELEQVNERLQQEIAERERANQSLHQSEERYRFLTKNIIDVIWTSDLSTSKFTYVSPAVRQMRGYRAGEKLQESWQDVLTPESYAKALKVLKKELENDNQPDVDPNRSVMIELEAYRKDGTTFWMENTIRFVRDAQQKPVGLIGVTRDITERKRALEILRKGDIRFRMLTENSNDIVTLIDKDGTILYQSQAMLRLLGFEPEEWVNRNAFELPHPDDRDEVGTHLRALMDNPGKISTVVYRAQHKDGTWHYLESVGQSMLDTPGVEAVVVHSRDVTERFEAEKALRESQQMLRQVLDTIPVRVFWKDSDGIFLGCNQPMANDAGLNSPEEIIGKTDFDMVWREQAEFYQADDKQVIESGQSMIGYEEPQPNIDGRKNWLRTSKVPLLDAEGQVQGVLGTYENITEFKKARGELQKKTEQLDRFFDVTLELLCIADTDGYFINLNPQWEKTLGYAKGDMEGKQFFDFIHPDDVEPTHQVISQLVGNQEVYNFINRYRCKDGSYRWLEWRAVPVGKLIYAAAHDITERQINEQKLRESEERLSAIVNNARDAIFIKDTNFRYILVNQAMCDLFKIDKENLLGSTDYDLFGEKQAESVNQFDRRVLGGEFAEEESERIINEEKRVFHTVQVPLRDGVGNIYGVCGIARDITERKRNDQERQQLEDQLRQAMKLEAIGRLAGGVAHDFNNLLTGITGYTEMLMASVSKGDPLHEDLEEIKKAADRGAALTSQLLAFSRKQVIEPKVIDLNELVSNSARMLKRLIGEDIDLLFRPTSRLGNIKADPNQIEQVLVNLTVNARDAMPDGGKLTIETANISIDDEYARNHPEAEAGEYVMLAVGDSGEGMDEDVRQHIFEPFFTTKDKEQGTGLGLAMIYGIVKQNNGFINLYSEPGEGSLFKIYLPRVEQKAEAWSKTEEQPIPRGRETVLLVEDEEMVRNLARKVLERYGYTVLEAVNGGDAYLQCKDYQGSIDLLLTDVIMPNMNGRQLYENIKTECPDIKVLYMSGYTQDVIAHHGVLDARTAFIQKPFAIETLARKVREVLDS